MSARQYGARWEKTAEDYLAGRGLKPLTRNFHCRLGEIDLVMQHKDCLVFVEVRYRASNARGGSPASVTASKQVRLSRAAGMFLNRHPHWARGACRFDVVAIEGPPDKPRLAWYRHAFESQLHG